MRKIAGLEIFIPDEPKRVRRRCPAIMLAVKRMERVNGRMINLIDSMITINGIRINGVPMGVRWVSSILR